MFDYDAAWAWDVQPHGAGLSYFQLVFDVYRGLRGLGLSVDILAPDTCDFAGYAVVLVPGMMHMSAALKEALIRAEAQIVLGPRSAARDSEFSIPVPLPPAFAGLDLHVTAAESLRSDCPEALEGGGAFTGYRELLDGGATVTERCADGWPAVMAANNLRYLAGWPDEAAMRRLLRDVACDAGLQTLDLPGAVRCRDTGAERFWFNFDTVAQDVAGRQLPPISVTREAKT
ncbi:beta-galactosidase trimerization domain-containing protein [Sulfitobacter albidus]|uniref:beta-galactosidase trimerization domain-containing protein n=1 Tax=Sulfitobacter albidus TaxID=2829501 RepID=UPI0020C8EA77|nr:beta-galactosidase trimerization domain-containing protein [Sulfitobacter albidus]